MNETLYIVLAFRYGGVENTFPIGVFNCKLEAYEAAKQHRIFRGFKYKHKIYEFNLNCPEDDYCGKFVEFVEGQS